MNGRTKGILAVVGSSLAIFWPGAFIFGIPGVLGPTWQQMFQTGRGAIGNTLFFVLAAVGFFMFFVGRWQEKVGTRKLITFGALLCGLNAFFLGHIRQLPLLYLWAFINGASSCFVYIPALTTVQRWYPEKRGLVSGIVNLAFGLSAALMAPLFGYLLQSLGYVSMHWVLGAMALGVGLIAAQFTETPKPIPASPGPAESDPKKTRSILSVNLTIGESLRSQSFWFLWLTWALQGAAGISMVTLSVQFGLHRGFSLTQAVMILTAFNLASGLSRIIMGYLSDRMRRNKAMAATFFAAAGAYFILPQVERFIFLLLLPAIVGFAFGTLFAVSAPLASDCFGLRHFGAIFGLVFTAYGFLAGPMGPSLSGYLLDSSADGFGLVFTFLGVYCFLSGVFILRVIPLQK
jgi:MFS transporter, OFA family, oxalate/formate antiporter